MTHTEVIKRMKKELLDYSDATLEHMLKVYDRIVLIKKEDLQSAKTSLRQCKRERTAILQEIAKRAENNTK